MKTARFIKTFAAVAAGTVLLTNAFAQSAKEVVGATPYVGIESEAPPNLTVDPPIPDQLARGVVEIQYRGGELAYRSGVRSGCPQRVSTGRASACNRRRPSLALDRP
jgi:Family of unknown function (DUF6130)